MTVAVKERYALPFGYSDENFDSLSKTIGRLRTRHEGFGKLILLSFFWNAHLSEVVVASLMLYIPFFLCTNIIRTWVT